MTGCSILFAISCSAFYTQNLPQVTARDHRCSYIATASLPYTPIAVWLVSQLYGRDGLPSSGNPSAQDAEKASVSGTHQHSPLHNRVHICFADPVLVHSCTDLVGHPHHLDRVVQDQAVRGPSLQESRLKADTSAGGDRVSSRCYRCSNMHENLLLCHLI